MFCRIPSFSLKKITVKNTKWENLHAETPWNWLQRTKQTHPNAPHLWRVETTIVSPPPGHKVPLENIFTIFYRIIQLILTYHIGAANNCHYTFLVIKPTHASPGLKISFDYTQMYSFHWWSQVVTSDMLQQEILAHVRLDQSSGHQRQQQRIKKQRKRWQKNGWKGQRAILERFLLFWRWNFKDGT